jgi:hypothetical protein
VRVAFRVPSHKLVRFPPSLAADFGGLPSGLSLRVEDSRAREGPKGEEPPSCPVPLKDVSGPDFDRPASPRLPGILFPLSEKGSPSPAGIQFSSPPGIFVLAHRVKRVSGPDFGTTESPRGTSTKMVTRVSLPLVSFVPLWFKCPSRASRPDLRVPSHSSPSPAPRRDGREGRGEDRISLSRPINLSNAPPSLRRGRRAGGEGPFVSRPITRTCPDRISTVRPRRDCRGSFSPLSEK